MIEVKENSEPRERALLVGIEFKRNDRWEIEDLLAELSQLAATAGLEVVGMNISRRSKPHPATYIGTGKAREIADRCRQDGVSLLIFNGDLSPAQTRNLQDVSGVRVLDRTELILEIFVQRARTREARLQIELAQLQYLLPRLTGAWTHLSRQKGGVKGTRDAGEKQIEIDRRKTRTRIQHLNKEIAKVRRHREAQRKQRRRAGIPLVSIIGYTNSGKSTLLNTLTAAAAPTEDKLFATLDPIIRKAVLPSGRAVLFSDTVGFIRQLPHHLIDAFRATLEEVGEADLLLEVLDLSHRMVWERKRSVEVVLKELSADEKPMVVVLNKIDLVEDEFLLGEARGRIDGGVPISALRKTGLEDLLKALDEKLAGLRRSHRLLIPQNRPDLVARLHRDGRVVKIDYHKKDVYVEVMIEDRFLEDARQYLLDG
ncbi:MAG: GTPase HflX [Candidatus Euphemobacter frigidus]|nr:GTPase HflX [Candidatus Euphemobacter frigidus]MDP8275077.1 GTPase HflX [Candidatus Euphemobacter frigidus]